MPSVFSLESPFGRTTKASLEFLTNTPEKTRAILKDMIAFLKKGDVSVWGLPMPGMPVLVAPSETRAPNFSKGQFKAGVNMIEGVLPVTLPEPALWISKDTYELWNHALLSSGMEGGLVLIGTPSDFPQPVFSGSIGRAGTVLLVVEDHVRKLEGGHNVFAAKNIALGIGAALLLGVAATVYVRSGRDRKV